MVYLTLYLSAQSIVSKIKEHLAGQDLGGVQCPWPRKEQKVILKMNSVRCMKDDYYDVIWAIKWLSSMVDQIPRYLNEFMSPPKHI